MNAVEEAKQAALDAVLTMGGRGKCPDSRPLRREPVTAHQVGGKSRRNPWAKSPFVCQATRPSTVWKKTPTMSIFDNTTFEIWLPIRGYVDFYSISNLARVRSEQRVVERGGSSYTVTERILKLIPNSDGYLQVHLSREGKQHTFYLHDLIMEAFVGEKPDGQEVRHLDDDKANCALANLAFGTRSENMQDSVRNGHHAYASRTECSQGHPYTEDNVARSANRPNARICKTCAREYQLRHQTNRRQLVSA